jgi:methylated-DNA-[protein]-cysteine S-methyltransferase
MNRLPASPPLELLDRVADRAAREGLVDVAYAQVDSPLGPLTVAATERGLVQLAYPEQPVDGVLERLAAEVSPRVLEAPSRLDGIRRELEEYFGGARQDFATPIDWSLTRGFYRDVLQATARIGFGQVSTYAKVAAGAGNAKAVRAAGSGLGSNPIPVVVPCHRVLRTGGGLGGYTGGLERKQFLLALEQR